MTNEEKYLLLSEEHTGLPSDMGVVPSGTDFTFSKESIEKSLSNGTDFQLKTFKTAQPDSPIVKTQFDAGIEYLGEKFHVILSVISLENLNLESFVFGNKVDEKEVEDAQKQYAYIEASMYLGNTPLAGFHLQLKILNTIVPQASLVIDFIPFRLLSGRWLKMTAQSSIPPSPDYLYTIHAVYSGEGDDTRYWLHTHGLHRCGNVELEIVDIGKGAQQMYDMLNVTAKMFLDGNSPKEKNKFTVGYDGLGISLCWVRWEDAISDIPSDAPGGRNDRGKGGDIHQEPSGVLFAVEDTHWVSPEIYAATLSDNPLYFISATETVRMSNLAKERFPLFKQTMESSRRKKLWNPFAKKDKEEWSFLVKLGLVVDNAEGENDKEHLWFNVIDIEGNNIYAELINEPYWIAAIKKGDKRKYPVDVLTDWIIYSPDNTYTPDSIYQLT